MRALHVNQDSSIENQDSSIEKMMILGRAGGISRNDFVLSDVIAAVMLVAVSQEQKVLHPALEAAKIKANTVQIMILKWKIMILPLKIMDFTNKMLLL